VTSTGSNEQSKALSEGFVSGMAQVNQGADLVAMAGIAEAARATGTRSSDQPAGTDSEGTGGESSGGQAATGPAINSFGAISAGQTRYNSGSHVDVESFSLLAGLALGTEVKPGHLTLGAFFEYGLGSYDTYNSFSHAADVHGSGDVYHLGGGILGRLDFNQTGPGHFYSEASVRAGGVHNKYNSIIASQLANYESSSAYYGLHLGAGYVWNIGPDVSLDTGAKVFWTRQEGEEVTLSSGDRVEFEASDSLRLRLGGRLSYDGLAVIRPYVGAAWEHEFEGQANANSRGFTIDAPSLSGDSAIGELGLVFKPSAVLPLSLDLGVQGYAGKREGISGSVQITWEF
jgi:outer membrane autotransporter protein